MYTDEELLQFFVAVIDAKLFETIDVKNFEAVNIEHTDNCPGNIVASVCSLHFDGAVHSLDNPGEKTIVQRLKRSWFITIEKDRI